MTPTTAGNSDTQAHTDFVVDALATFRHARVHDEGTEQCFERFRDLAKQFYPDADPFERMERSFRVLSEVISTMEIGAARARAVFDLMERMYEEAKS